MRRCGSLTATARQPGCARLLWTNRRAAWRRWPSPRTATAGRRLRSPRRSLETVDSIGLEPDPNWDPAKLDRLLTGRRVARLTHPNPRYGRLARAISTRFQTGWNAARLFADGRLLIFGAEETARFLWIEPGPRLRLLEDYKFWGKPTQLAFSSDGRRLLLEARPLVGPYSRIGTGLPSNPSVSDYKSHLLRLRVTGLTNSAYTLQVSPDLEPLAGLDQWRLEWQRRFSRAQGRDWTCPLILPSPAE